MPRAAACSPERRFARLGAPALVALLPQDTFYSIQSDVLSPLCFGAAFLALLRFTRSDRPDAATGALAGLALAAAALTKNTNVPLVALAGVFVLVRRAAARRGGPTARSRTRARMVRRLRRPAVRRLARPQPDRARRPDRLGCAGRAGALGAQADRSVVAPSIFTPEGLGSFLRDVTVSFWRGEFVWQGGRLASTAADALYMTTTALFLAFAALRLLPRFHRPARERRDLGFAFTSLLASLGFLVLLSVAIDFRDSRFRRPNIPTSTRGAMRAAR